MKIDDIPGSKYESICSLFSQLPATWFPGMLRNLVEAADAKKVFVEGGASEWVKRVEKDIEAVKAQEEGR